MILSCRGENLNCSGEDRRILYLLIKENLSILSQSELQEAIDSVKNFEDKAIDFWNKYLGPIGFVLNNLLAQLGFESVEISNLEKSSGKIGTFRDQLKFISKIALQLGFKSIYILIDKIDETAITQTASKSFDFIKNLLSDLQILELPNYGFKFFLWDKLLDDYRKIARPDRIKYYALNWNSTQLTQMLSKRLGAYSQGKILSFKNLTAFPSKIDIDLMIVSFGQGSPRNIIRICKEILDQQAEIDANTSKISETAFIKGFETFAENYSFENFPEKMILELKKNRRIDFTINHVYNDVFKFTQQAGISKVATWENMGLVEKIGTIRESKGTRPSYHYCIMNIIIAKNIFSDLNIFNFFGNKVRWCPNCGKLLLRDWDIDRSLSCDSCQTDVTKPIFTEMVIIQDNADKTETAEIEHPILGKRVISSKDAELKQIRDKLKSTTNIQFSMASNELFGFDAKIIKFYLGFLYNKKFIDYKLIDENIIEIYLTTKGKIKLGVKP
ncbi:Uncharacterised protein [uncultured archaeon]|nr:Uncharacterised protein [uncultured archaeon]